MYNTPASRTSRHGSSKKQRRAKQSQPQSRSSTPVTTPVVLPEPVEEPMDNALETKEEDFQKDLEGALDIVLDAEPVQEEGAGADSEGVEAAEVVVTDEMDAWFTEAMAAPQAPLEEQPFPEVLTDVYSEDLQEGPFAVEDMLHPDDESERLEDSTAFEEPAPSGPAELAPMPDQVSEHLPRPHEDPTDVGDMLLGEEPARLELSDVFEEPDAIQSGPGELALMPDQGAEDLLLSINVGAERAVEDYRTVERATSPVKPIRNIDAADKPNIDGRGDDIEFPPASTDANAGHVRAPIIAR